MRPLYHSFAWAYDLIIPAPAGPAAEAIGRAFRDEGVPEGGSIVDAGCGTGEYAIALTEAGFEVTGVDASPELIEVARAKSGRARFEVGDIGEWQPADRADGVLCRGVLNDVVPDDERNDVVANLHSILEPGGVLIFDVRDWQRSAARYSAQPVFQRTVAADGGTVSFRSETKLQPEGHCLLVHELYGRDGETVAEHDFVMRCWSRLEIVERLARAGFRRSDILDGDNDRVPARDDRLVAIAVSS